MTPGAVSLPLQDHERDAPEPPGSIAPSCRAPVLPSPVPPTHDAGTEDGFGMWDEFEVERYLQYHGEKLVRRFDANSYLVIAKAMDLHDVARGRGGLEAAMSRIAVPNLTIGINSDMLYPDYQQKHMSDLLSATGVANEYVEIDSHHGHDAFLIHSDEVGGPIARFLDRLD